MGLSTAYYTVDGELIGEATNGVRLDYLTDGLGSVTAKINQAGVIESNARYNPFGTLLSGPSYIFGWIGVHGYRSTGGNIYVRARHYSADKGLWSSADDLWPDESTYTYVDGRPTNDIDPTGLLTLARNYPIIKGEPHCNFFKVYWKFTVNPKLSGCLIQAIRRTKSIHTCDNKVQIDDYCPHYYEAWLVIRGKVKAPTDYSGRHWTNTKDYNDNWGSIKPHICTHGTDTMFGQLTFIADDSARYKHKIWTATPPPDFSPANKVHCSGALPSTGHFSNTGVYWQAEATLRDKWWCCKQSKKNCYDSSACKKCHVPGPCKKESFHIAPYF